MFTRLEAENLVGELADWVGSDPTHTVYRAAMLLLLGVGRRKHLDDLTRFSQYPREFVRSCLANARRAGIWRGESKITYVNWEAEPIEFLLDAMTVAGLIERVEPYSYRRASSTQ